MVVELIEMDMERYKQNLRHKRPSTFKSTLHEVSKKHLLIGGARPVRGPILITSLPYLAIWPTSLVSVPLEWI